MLLLGVMLVFALSAACAESQGTTGDLTWTVNDGNELTIAGSGAMPDYTMADGAPWGRDIVSVTIGDGVTGIGKYAFCNCNHLTSASLGSSVATIGECAFYGCVALDQVNLPDSLTAIGPSAFSCAGMSGITFPTDLNLSIGTFAFACSGLENVLLPDNVTAIGANAFMNCHSLQSVTLGSGAAVIPAHAFQGCENLTGVSIPSGVTTISLEAFSGAALSEVNLPDTVTVIGRKAFAGSDHTFEKITLPAGMTSLTDAFEDNESLTDVYLPETFALDTTEFWVNAGLTGDVRIHAAIGSDAARNLGSFVPDGYEGLLAEYEMDADNREHWRLTGMYTSLSCLDIPAGITEIADGAFMNEISIESIIFTDPVAIGEDAFFGTGLQGLSLPGNIVSIGTAAFAECESLTEVSIPGDIAALPDLMFSGCTSLANVNIGQGVTSIGSEAFANTAITQLWLPESVTALGNGLVTDAANLDSLYIEGSVTGNTDGTDHVALGMRDAARLFAVVGSQTPAVTGEYAFTAFNGVTMEYDPDLDGQAAWIATGYWSEDGVVPAQIIFDEGTTHIAGGAYAYTATTDFGLPSTLKEIGSCAFQGSGMGYVTIPASVATIGEAAFSYIPSLTSVEIPQDTLLTAIPDYCFLECTTLTQIALPEAITDIGECAFRGCTELSGVSMPGVVTIGYRAFGNTALQTVEFPASLQSIGAEAFWRTNLYEPLTISADVQFVGADAFSETLIPTVTFLGAETGLSGAITDDTRVQTGDMDDVAVMYASPLTNTAVSLSNYFDSFVEKDDNDWTYVWAFRDGVHWKSSYTQAYLNRQYTQDENQLLVALAYGGQGGEVTVLSGVNVLGANLFQDRLDVISVNLPTSLRIIDEYAFSHVENMTGIALPQGTLYLGARAFEHCKAMTSVTLPDSMNSLDNYVFDGCLQVPGIVLPDNMNYVGDNVLGASDVAGDRTFSVNIGSQTVSLLGNYSFFYDRQNPDYRYRWVSYNQYLNGQYVYVNGLELNRYMGSETCIVIDSRVVSIGEYAFTWWNSSTGTAYVNTTLEEITFPEGLVYIGNYSFNGSTALSQIHLPSTLTAIGYMAFEYCPLTSLTIPDSVTNIGSYAFAGTGLPEVTLKNDGVYFGEWAFSLPTKVHCGLDSYTAHRLSDHQVPFFANDLDAAHSDLEDCALRYVRSDLGDGTETLRLMGYYGTEAFITLSDYIESVANTMTLSGARVLADPASNAAQLMSGTTESYASAGHEVYHPLGFAVSETDDFNYAWIGDENPVLTLVQYYGSAERLTELPAIAEAMDSRLFYCYDENDVMPKLVCKPASHMGRLLIALGDSFYYYYDPDDEGLQLYKTSVIQYTGTAANLEIPEGITRIESSAMFENATVTRVVLPTTLDSVGSCAFQNMRQLAEVVFQSASMSVIESQAFLGCGLTSVHIPGDVGEIQGGAFAALPSLVSFTVDGHADTISGYILNDACSDVPVTICFAGGVTQIGQYSFNMNNVNHLIVVLGEGTQTIDDHAFVNLRIDTKIYLPASVTSLQDNSFSSPYGSVFTCGVVLCAPLDSYAAHFIGEHGGWFVAEDDFGYAYADGSLTLVDYRGAADAAAPSGDVAAIALRSGAQQPRLIADSSSALAQVISTAGMDFTPSASSEWDYRWVDGKLYGARYYGAQTEFTALPQGMDGILPGAVADDVRFICGRSDPMAQAVEYFYESADSDWKLRWNDGALTIAEYTGADTEIASFPEDVNAVDEGAFPDGVRLICDRNDAIAPLLEGFYESAASDWKLRWNGTVLTIAGYTGTDTEITSFPSGVTEVDEGAFPDGVAFVCDMNSDMAHTLSLAGYAFFSDATHAFQLRWTSENLVLLDGGQAAGEQAIPAGVTEIAENAFCQNASLTAVTVPSSVKKIGSYAFAYCSSLRQASLSEGLEEIGDGIFYDCSLLSELRLPDSVTKTGSTPISSGKLYLPDHITVTDIRTSYELSREDVYVHADSDTARAVSVAAGDWETAQFRDPDDNYIYAWMDAGTHLLLTNAAPGTSGTVSLRDDIYSIVRLTTFCTSVKNLVLPSALREFYDPYGWNSPCFGGSTESITFPEGLTVIPYNLVDPGALSSVVIPRSVISIDDNAFPDSLMTVYGYAGTEAEDYALRKGLDFIDLDEMDPDDAVISPNQEIAVVHTGDVIDLHDLVSVTPALSTPYALSATSADETVLTVSGASVTVVGPGSTQLAVWVTDHEITEISVNVTAYNPVADFDVPEDCYLYIYNSASMSVTNVTPENAAPNFVWTDNNGNTYGTGSSVGIYLGAKVNRTITVTSHNGIAKSFRVIGYQTLGNMTLTARNTMKVGEVQTPTVKIRVDTTTRTDPQGLYTLTSSDESVAVVENGRIRAVGAGTAVITAQHVQDTDGSKKKTVTITVTDPTVFVLPGDLLEIDEEAFAYVQVDKIVLPGSLTTIGEGAFAHSGICIIVIPDSVTYIPASAFDGVGTLTIQCPEGSAADIFAHDHGYATTR